MDWVGSPCSLGDSKESSPAPQFQSINSLVLSFLYIPTLTFIHDHWKNHSFDWTDLCWQRVRQRHTEGKGFTILRPKYSWFKQAGLSWEILKSGYFHMTYSPLYQDRMTSSYKSMSFGDFSGNPAVKTLHFHPRGPRFNAPRGPQILLAT